MAMSENDKEYLSRLSLFAATVAGCGVDVAERVIMAALKEADIDFYDFRRLGSGDYTLCDGYCYSS